MKEVRAFCSPFLMTRWCGLFFPNGVISPYFTTAGNNQQQVSLETTPDPHCSVTLSVSVIWVFLNLSVASDTGQMLFCSTDV